MSTGNDTLVFGTSQLLNVSQYISHPGTQPTAETNGTAIYAYIAPRSGTLSNFYLYQQGPNFSGTYPSGDASSTYQLLLNDGNSGYVAFTVNGEDPASTTPVMLSDTTTSITVNPGDLISFKITPTDTSGVFMGGWNLLFSMQFS